MDEVEIACLAIIIALSTTKCGVRRTRRVKELLKKRQKHSHVNLLREIHVTDSDDYKNYLRISDAIFETLVGMLKPFLSRQNTNMRTCLSVEDRLAVTLRYLATGRSFEDLKFSAKMSPASISIAILETCKMLARVLQNYIKMPSTSEEWKQTANEFGAKYKFWNCLGAINGKHVALNKPAHSGSSYCNYNGFYSIALLALVNAKREFLMVDVGINGRISDEGVLSYSEFGKRLHQNSLNLPDPSPLPNSSELHPFVFISDEAFALNVNLMKPYSQLNLNDEQRLFNHRLYPARFVVKDAFGILTSRFGVFRKAIGLEPQKAAIITQACCYLHNFLIKQTAPSTYVQPSTSEDSIENSLLPLKSTPNRNGSAEAKIVRDNFCKYYNNEGKLQ